MMGNLKVAIDRLERALLAETLNDAKSGIRYALDTLKGIKPFKNEPIPSSRKGKAEKESENASSSM